MIENLPQSVLSNKPDPRMSSKYGFVDSFQVAQFLENEGWNLVSANGRRLYKKSNPDLINYQAHWLRFRKLNFNTSNFQVSDLLPEIYFRNSHNGSSGIVFEAGLFRLICSNGLIVKDSSLMKIRLRHSLKNASDIKPFIEDFIHGFDKIGNRIQNMKDISLSPEEQLQFAKLSQKILWGEHIPKDIVEKILTARRPEDNHSDLWSVYNRIQENLSKGGIEGVGTSLNKNGKVRKIKTRQIQDSFRYISFNSKLWELTESRLDKGVFELV